MFNWINLIAGAVLGILATLLFSWAIWVPLERREARAGYVVEARATAAEARLAETQRQIAAGQIVIDSYQLQLKNLRVQQQLEDETDAERNKQYELLLQSTGRAWLLDQSDLDFILQ